MTYCYLALKISIFDMMEVHDEKIQNILNWDIKFIGRALQKGSISFLNSYKTGCCIARIHRMPDKDLFLRQE